MSDDVQDAVFDILERIQADAADFRRSVEERLDRIEQLQRKQRRDAAGMLVMMRSIVTDFDERVSEVEERLLALESRRS
jgi:DNA repair ATPase RecN